MGVILVVYIRVHNGMRNNQSTQAYDVIGSAYIILSESGNSIPRSNKTRPILSNLLPLHATDIISYKEMQRSTGEQDLLGRAEEMVKAHMAKCVHPPAMSYWLIYADHARYDPSHDWAHGVLRLSWTRYNVLIPQWTV
jgi:hypothetical protein